MDRRPHPLLHARPLLMLLTAAGLAATALLFGCGGGTATTTTTAAPSSSTTLGSAASTAPGEESTYPVTVTDDNGTTVTISKKPMRIVSTAPSNTEILFALGAGDRVVGVTSLDDYPPEVADIDKVGDFQPNAEAIIALQPDLVVAYSGNEDALKPVTDAGTPVLILNPASLEGIYADIVTVGRAVGTSAAAEKLVTTISTDVEGLAATAKETGVAPKVFYALDNTLWTAGPGSFVDELLHLANARNIGASGSQAYFQLTAEQLVAADPDLVLLPKTVFQSPDVFTKDPRFTNLRAVKEGKVLVIDDVIVTRPGPRIAEGLRVLVKAIHPNAL